MVLILLSSPNPMTPLLPPSPRSKDFSSPSSLFSPKTPATPSPSFFAILSPIFTADDNLPSSPLPRQLSPGTIPPETPPPWLLGPQSPASPGMRPAPLRQPSSSSESRSRQLPLPRLSTTEGISTNSPRMTPASRPLRPGLPAITHSFTSSSGTPQPFRPPPRIAMKRINTAPVVTQKGPTSPLARSWRAVSEPTKTQQQETESKTAKQEAMSMPMPTLHRAKTAGVVPKVSVRPPSRELAETATNNDANVNIQSPGDDSLEDEEARHRLSVAVMGIDSVLMGSGFEGMTATSTTINPATVTATSTSTGIEKAEEKEEENETMEVPLALEIEAESKPATSNVLSTATRPRPALLSKPIPRSIGELRGQLHARSKSLEVAAPAASAISSSASTTISMGSEKEVGDVSEKEKEMKNERRRTSMVRPLQLTPAVGIRGHRSSKSSSVTPTMAEKGMGMGVGASGPLGKLAGVVAKQS